jgi:hypothetical protein
MKNELKPTPPPIAPTEKKPTELFKIFEAQKLEIQDFKRPYSKWSFMYWRENYREKKQKRNTFFIIMQMRNGKLFMFRISTWKNYFEKFGGIYYLDVDMSREETHSGLNCLYFHQDISTPFKINFDLDTIHKLVKKSEREDNEQSIDKALNPTSLKGFINSQVIEKVLKGQELSDEMRFIKILIVINLILTVLGLIIMGKSLGWF